MARDADERTLDPLQADENLLVQVGTVRYAARSDATVRITLDLHDAQEVGVRIPHRPHTPARTHRHRIAHRCFAFSSATSIGPKGQVRETTMPPSVRMVARSLP